jgi:threonine synthase
VASRVVVLPGDGIGPEVAAAAVRVLERLPVGVETEEHLFGGAGIDAVVAPIASGAMYSKLGQGFDQLGRVGLVDARPPRLFGGQAEGCSPVATAFHEGRPVMPVRPDTVAHSLAIGNPADGDLAVATAKASGGAIHAVAEEDVGANMTLLASTTGVFGETAAGVSLGALRAAVAAGELGASDRVVLLVTGTGLKTPQVVRSENAVVEVDPDVDNLLAGLGVGA